MNYLTTFSIFEASPFWYWSVLARLLGGELGDCWFDVDINTKGYEKFIRIDLPRQDIKNWELSVLKEKSLGGCRGGMKCQIQISQRRPLTMSKVDMALGNPPYRKFWYNFPFPSYISLLRFPWSVHISAVRSFLYLKSIDSFNEKQCVSWRRCIGLSGLRRSASIPYIYIAIFNQFSL